MDKTYIGLDPGSKGVIAVLAPDGPEFTLLEGLGPQEIAEAFYSVAARFPRRFCVMEDVRALHGASSTSTFNFGFNKGFLCAMLWATGTPFELVLPQRWQNGVWTPNDKEYMPAKEGSKPKVDTKKTTINAARRLFPHVDLRRSEQCRRADDGKADALMMAEYGRRNNL